MRDTPRWQVNIIAATAAFLGIVVSVTVLNLIWSLAFEPANCDTRRLPDGSLVDPICTASTAPMWLFGLVAVGGALVGYWIYQFARTRSRA